MELEDSLNSINYTLRGISDTFSIFAKKSDWIELTKLTINQKLYWRTRWNPETKLLIEEESKSKYFVRDDSSVVTVHQDVESMHERLE